MTDVQAICCSAQIRALGNSFSTYLHSFIVLESPDGMALSITYVPYEYDYIDTDLDYDELHYAALIAQFSIQLEDLATSLVASNRLAYVSIVRGKMLFPHQHVLESHVTIQQGHKTNVTYI